MNKFMDGVLEWKTHACMMFTGSIIVMWLIGLGFQWESIPMGMLLDMFIISFLCSLLQGLVFTRWIFKKLAYSLRLLLFAIPFLGILAAFAVKRNWFPTSQLIGWFIFIGIFIFIFIVMAVFFEIYFRFVGKKYDGLLGERQKNMDGK